MNTVDALNVLGKALCGDSFEVKPGLTDAETILEIAKNYTGGSGGSESSTIVIVARDGSGPGEINYDALPAGLKVSDFAGAICTVYSYGSSEPTEIQVIDHIVADGNEIHLYLARSSSNIFLNYNTQDGSIGLVI